jgi:hypothetical protein
MMLISPEITAVFFHRCAEADKGSAKHRRRMVRKFFMGAIFLLIKGIDKADGMSRYFINFSRAIYLFFNRDQAAFVKEFLPISA